MSEAMKLIVDSFVSLKNRQALEEMREHRQRLKAELQRRSSPNFDFSGAMRDIDGDLSEIESGFSKL
jgi:hypothetical protein